MAACLSCTGLVWKSWSEDIQATCHLSLVFFVIFYMLESLWQVWVHDITDAPPQMTSNKYLSLEPETISQRKKKYLASRNHFCANKQTNILVSHTCQSIFGEWNARCGEELKLNRQPEAEHLFARARICISSSQSPFDMLKVGKHWIGDKQKAFGTRDIFNLSQV